MNDDFMSGELAEFIEHGMEIWQHEYRAKVACVRCGKPTPFGIVVENAPGRPPHLQAGPFCRVDCLLDVYY